MRIPRAARTDVHGTATVEAMRKCVYGTVANFKLCRVPDGCFWRQPIDQEIAGLKRCVAMGAGGCDQNNPISRLQGTLAVYNQAGLQRPALMRLCLDPVSYTHPRAPETIPDIECRLLLERKTHH